MSDYFVQNSPVSSFLGAYQQGQEMQHQRAIEAAQQIAAKHQQEMADVQQQQQAQQQQAQAANQLLGHIVTALGQGYTGDEATKLATPFAGAAGVTLPDLAGLQGAPAKQASLDAKQKLADAKGKIWEAVTNLKGVNAEKLKAMQFALERADSLPAAEQLYVKLVADLGQPGAAQQGTTPAVDPLAAPSAPSVQMAPQGATPESQLLGAPAPPAPDPLVQATQAGAGIAPMPPFGGIVGAKMDRMKARTIAEERLHEYRAAMMELNRKLTEKRIEHYTNQDEYNQWKVVNEAAKTSFDQQFRTNKEKFDEGIKNQGIALRQAAINLQKDSNDRQAAGLISSSRSSLQSTRGQMDRLLNTMDGQVNKLKAERAAVNSLLKMQPPPAPPDDADTRTKQQYAVAVQQYNFKRVAAQDRADEIPIEIGDLRAHQDEINAQKKTVQRLLDPTEDTQNLGKPFVPNLPPVLVIPGALKGPGTLPGMPGQGSKGPLKPKGPTTRYITIGGKKIPVQVNP